MISSAGFGCGQFPAGGDRDNSGNTIETSRGDPGRKSSRVFAIPAGTGVISDERSLCRHWQSAALRRHCETSRPGIRFGSRSDIFLQRLPCAAFRQVSVPEESPERSFVRSVRWFHRYNFLHFIINDDFHGTSVLYIIRIGEIWRSVRKNPAEAGLYKKLRLNYLISSAAITGAAVSVVVESIV